MLFHSSQPPITVPPNITIWQWLSSLPSLSLRPSQQAGFLDASTNQRLSWTDLRHAATHLSTALVHLGLKSGDTVALFSPNSIYYPVAMFAALRVGGVVSGASPAYGVEEMVYALKTSGAKWLFAHKASMSVAAEAARQAGLGRERVIVLDGGSVEGHETLQGLIRKGKEAGEQVQEFSIPEGRTNFDVCGFLSFSSGTTGLPKAVMIAHQNVIAQCLQVQQLTPDTHRKVLAVLPLFHITGLVHVLHLPLLINAEVIMLPAFSMESMLDAVVKYRIQELLLVPPILIRMIRDPIVDKYDLSFIQRFSSGAAPLSEEVIQALQRKFPNTGFKQGYGMTESCSCITAHPQDKYDYRYAHRVGAVVASTTLKIIRPDGTLCGRNEPGELCAKGPQIVMGYLNNEKATRETFDADGFLHTGDQGKIDDEGLVTITDRIKEMIKVKGIAVAPAELEDLLLGHEAVEDVAVLGVTDDYSGERPKAYVVLKPAASKGKDNAQLVEVGKALLSYVRENKVRHKHIREIEFADEIPKSASGKILRRVLKDKEKDRSKRGVVVRDDAQKAKL
ncbi:acetyl-CoA synthetase-like protein [Myriangium duriaei CBS 260.36]|uniref:Acetyl-CoA synthetase-like protein n=1 Tax=Myriangium duriaei CBS 260.36 TaxID=1168546 RepID=A0A9P4MLX8_9PEZI|nr:acetyl-CoA synthetase-like protein [Myriangium duriaei CBS 260.36]